MAYSLAQLKSAQQYKREQEALEGRRLFVRPVRGNNGSIQSYRLVERLNGNDTDMELGTVPTSYVKRSSTGQGDNHRLSYKLDKDTYLREGLGFSPPPSDYSKMLQSALSNGTDLRSLYGKTYEDAKQFKKDLGQSGGKDASMIIPANPVGYQGGFEFDPNFGSSAYREMALQSGRALGLSEQESFKLGNDYFKEQFYSGSKTKGVIGFKDFGEGLLDTIAGQSVRNNAQALGENIDVNKVVNELKTTSLAPLYEANKNIFGSLKDAAAIESQSSGVFKMFGRSLAKAGPVSSAILTAALGPLGAGLSTAVAGAVAASTPSVLQGDVSGALKAGLAGLAASQVAGAVGGKLGGMRINPRLSAALSRASGGVTGGLLTGADPLKSGLTSALTPEFGKTGSELGQNLLPGQVGEILGSGISRGAIAGLTGGDIQSAFFRGAGKEGLSAATDAFKGTNFYKNFKGGLDLPSIDLPDFDLPGIDLPDLNFPDFNLNKPGFKAPSFNTGNNAMSIVDGLFSRDGLSSVINAIGAERSIDRIRGLGQKGSSAFGNIAKGAREGTEFIPFNVSSGAGRSRFTDDSVLLDQSPEQREMTRRASLFGAGVLSPYENPQLQSLGQEALGGARGLLTQGQQSTQEMADELYRLQQDMAQPGIDRDRLALEDRLRRQGRLGVSSGMFGGSPEMLALEKAIQEQDSANRFSSLSGAEGMATSRLARGKGLFDVGTNAIRLPEAINAQRAQTGGLLQEIALRPDRFLLEQAKLGAGMGGQRAQNNLASNSLVAGLLSKGASYPLQAESVAGALEAGRFDTLNKLLTGNNAVGNSVSGLLGEAGNFVKGLFGGNQPGGQPQSPVFNYSDNFSYDAPMDNRNPTDFFQQYPDLYNELNPLGSGIRLGKQDYSFFT